MNTEIDGIEIEYKFCLACGAKIPKFKIDKLGRRQTRTSNYCDNKKKCRNAKVYENNPGYQKDYYAKNKDRFKEYQKRYRSKFEK